MGFSLVYNTFVTLCEKLLITGVKNTFESAPVINVCEKPGGVSHRTLSSIRDAQEKFEVFTFNDSTPCSTVTPLSAQALLATDANNAQKDVACLLRQIDEHIAACELLRLTLFTSSDTQTF